MVENLQDMLDLPGLVVVLTILAREFLAGNKEMRAVQSLDIDWPVKQSPENGLASV